MKTDNNFPARLVSALRGQESTVEVYWDPQDPCNEGPAFRDNLTGESGGLYFAGWDTLDGKEQDTQGYALGDYFRENGKYAGPDCDGVYPHLES